VPVMRPIVPDSHFAKTPVEVCTHTANVAAKTAAPWRLFLRGPIWSVIITQELVSRITGTLSNRGRYGRHMAYVRGRTVLTVLSTGRYTSAVLVRVGWPAKAGLAGGADIYLVAVALGVTTGIAHAEGPATAVALRQQGEAGPAEVVQVQGGPLLVGPSAAGPLVHGGAVAVLVGVAPFTSRHSPDWRLTSSP
jgi:hypothetical protein